MHPEDPNFASALSAYKKRTARRAPEPQRMGNVVAQLVARRGYLQQKSTNELSVAWEKEAAKVGADGKTRIGRISRGVLEVFVLNSALLQMLTFHKVSLTKAMKAAAGGSAIKEVRFKVGPIA
jgi:hypothetical protein